MKHEMPFCFICGALVLYFQSASSQSLSQSYVTSRTMTNDSGTACHEKIDYYDGLGRPIETVLKGESPDGRDIATLQVYDDASRACAQWLPIAVSNQGRFVTPNEFRWKAVGNPVYEKDAEPFSRTVYEPSPLNHVAEQYGAGAEWHTKGKSLKTTLLLNDMTGELACSSYMVNDNGALKRNGLHPRGTLYVQRTIDEDGHTLYTFIDVLGQKILERRMNGGYGHDTYYVYDDYGNLCYVLPPEASIRLLQNEVTWTVDDNDALSKFAYAYKYDRRQRVVEKRLPGCEPVFIRYDKANHQVFTQDGNQRARGEWTFTFCDALGREAVRGIWKGADVPSLDGITVQAVYDGGAKLGGYAVNLSLPNGCELMTVNYYDTYHFLNLLEAREKVELSYSDLNGYGKAWPNAKGLPTGKRTYWFNFLPMGLQLTSTNDPKRVNYMASAQYYDNRGRVAQSRSTNQLQGFDHVWYAYSFTGKVLKKRHEHSTLRHGSHTEETVYAYDHAERLTSVSHQVDDNPPVALAQYQYDEVGRLKEKKLHGGLETISYGYNVRSWPVSIQSKNLTQKLYYQHKPSWGGNTFWNGNISSMEWRTGNEAKTRQQFFNYDALSRLTLAGYNEAGRWNGHYDVSYGYDRNGNLMTMKRRGLLDDGEYGMMDDLTCKYNGNQVTKVTNAVENEPTYKDAFHFTDRTDEAAEYGYDANGNIIQDKNKEMTVTYNPLNLPNEIVQKNGKIKYGFSATGELLSEEVTSYSYIGNQKQFLSTCRGGPNFQMPDSLTQSFPKFSFIYSKIYCGNIIHEGIKDIILTDEGYITFEAKKPIYHYYLKDHLSGNRVVIDQTGKIEQINLYYPYGGLIGESTNGGVQAYKYNGKELQRDNGLDQYYYGARMYDAALGRWTTMDPSCEKYYSVSPYTYCAGNPMNNIDKDGKFGEEWMAEWSRLIYNATHTYPAGPVKHNPDAKKREFRYTYDTFGSNNGEFYVTSNYKFDKSFATGLQNMSDGMAIIGYGMD